MEDLVASQSLPDESALIRAEITRFLREERLQPKLDKLEKELESGKITPEELETKHARLHRENTPAAWLQFVLEHTHRLQEATHLVKFSHPQARGATSIGTRGHALANRSEVGTHSLRADQIVPDVAIDDAKYLPIYKFLSIRISGTTLHELAQRRSRSLAAALSGDGIDSEALVEAFAALPATKGKLASHTLAKQVYWPVEARSYHLLAPLLSSPLAHALYNRIRDDRFLGRGKGLQKRQTTSARLSRLSRSRHSETRGIQRAKHLATQQ